jgi:hypothetical protein
MTGMIVMDLAPGVLPTGEVIYAPPNEALASNLAVVVTMGITLGMESLINHLAKKDPATVLLWMGAGAAGLLTCAIAVGVMTPCPGRGRRNSPYLVRR